MWVAEFRKTAQLKLRTTPYHAKEMWIYLWTRGSIHDGGIYALIWSLPERRCSHLWVDALPSAQWFVLGGKKKKDCWMKRLTKSLGRDFQRHYCWVFTSRKRGGKVMTDWSLSFHATEIPGLLISFNKTRSKSIWRVSIWLRHVNDVMKSLNPWIFCCIGPFSAVVWDAGIFLNQCVIRHEMCGLWLNVFKCWGRKRKQSTSG